jgi:hypothetical protein
MGSVASVNPGVSDVLQILSNAGSTSLSSALSSKSVRSALESASSGDIVQLSQQALQLQEASDLFGGQASADPGSLLLQALDSATAGSTTAAATTPSEAAATAAANAASEEVSALLEKTTPSRGQF